MKESILIRVVPENFAHWRNAHDECQAARLDYGITDSLVYRDEQAPNTVLVTLHVENMEKALAWFRDQRFKDAVVRAGNVTRQIWLANVKQ